MLRRCVSANALFAFTRHPPPNNHATAPRRVAGGIVEGDIGTAEPRQSDRRRAGTLSDSVDRHRLIAPALR